MAGAGYKLFNTGDVLTAAQVNTYLQEQAVMRFANATARTTALSGVLAEGMMSYLDDTNSVEVYNGSAWVSVGSTGDITGVTAGTGISGGGTSGDVTITNSMATAIDAKGDLVVGTGADTFSRLAVGTNGFQLVADSAASTGLKWEGFIGCTAAGAGATIGSGTATAIAFTSESFDTDSFHNNVTNNTRFTIPTGKGGYYLLTATVRKETNSTTGTYFVHTIRKNVSTIVASSGIGAAYSGGYPYLTASVVVSAVAGDYFESYILQDSGGNLDFSATQFSIVYLGV